MGALVAEQSRLKGEPLLCGRVAVGGFALFVLRGMEQGWGVEGWAGEGAGGAWQQKTFGVGVAGAGRGSGKEGRQQIWARRRARTGCVMLMDRDLESCRLPTGKASSSAWAWTWT